MHIIPTGSREPAEVRELDTCLRRDVSRAPGAAWERGGCSLRFQHVRVQTGEARHVPVAPFSGPARPLAFGVPGAAGTYAPGTYPGV